jgi:acyl-CoA thioester hydrolase
MTSTTFGATVRRRVYLDDIDGFGMLHHSRYLVLVDRAIIDYWHERGWSAAAGPSIQAIREVNVTFHAPVTGVCDVDVRFWIDSAGRSSLVYAFEIHSDDGSVCHAEGTRVLVNLDRQTLAPRALSDDDWAQARPLCAPGVAPR